VNGQGVIGPGCAWCGLPAVGDVEVQPAQHRTVTRRDPISGERATHQVFTRAAIRVPACSEHQQIKAGQRAPVGLPRQRTAQNVEQLGMFPDDRDERLRNAIYRETGR